MAPARRRHVVGGGGTPISYDRRRIISKMLVAQRRTALE